MSGSKDPEKEVLLEAFRYGHKVGNTKVREEVVLFAKDRKIQYIEKMLTTELCRRPASRTFLEQV